MPSTQIVPAEQLPAETDAVAAENAIEPSGDTGNPWLDFFEAMRNAPRDEHWHEFMRVMRERPMNRPPVDRNLFVDTD